MAPFWLQLCCVLLFTVVRIDAEELAPPYFNLADNRRIYASATCGEDVTGPELYCKLVGASSSSTSGTSPEHEIIGQVIQGQICDTCDASGPKSHPATNAIDGTSNWWQSPPMSRGLKYAQVNLTIDLGQEFHVAYVLIKMANSPRPGVWVLERSTDNGKTYHPWQYFADTVSDCVDWFGQDSINPINRDDSVICETQFSKVVPLEDGEIVVSLLNNRPSANNFFNSTVLQEWTKATNIRFRLLRPKTLLGQWTSFSRNDFTLTRRFFYSVRDISIGGRCVCNGHAESCDITDPDDSYKLLCRCQHNTCGPQCERCCPGFVQKAWRQSKAYDPFVCEPCNCFGHSEECEYDPDVDLQGLSLDINGNYEGGGVCRNCRHNTEGINCHKCKATFYRPADKPLNATDACQPCRCDIFYSTGNCAEGTGMCECRPEFQSPLCDSCSTGFYGYPDCRPCDCDVNGTRGGVCEVGGGQCPCKHNYAGLNCDMCAEGFYNFPDCIPCECTREGAASDVCDMETGQCQCVHNFGGRSCERCEHGFFNFPQCAYCNCDPRGTVTEICDKEVGKCLCKPGYDGARCDQCSPGFYGYPDCRPCACSEVGSMSTICAPNGKCPCLPNFSGRACDQCSPGYYKYPECLGCQCDNAGSLGVSCDDEGRCQCRSNFDGQRCDRCRESFYNYPACEDCNCDPAGVVEAFAGCGSVPKGELCQCKERVQGRICNQCKPLFWNMQANNSLGCEDCNCNTAGTVAALRTCESTSGQCACKPRVQSRRCTECADGFFNLQEDNLFGCMDCGCNLGGSISPQCDKTSGQCVCRARVTGRSCDEPLKSHYFPTLYQYQFEAEDGYTPSRSPVRFAYDDQVFPGYSWRGYAVFSQIQNEILQDFLIEKPSLYRMVLRYVNPNDETILAKVTLSPENPNDVEQSYFVRMEPTREPKIVTVAGPSGNLPTPFILNPGSWTAGISANTSLFLDYFALLPAAYYEATILQEQVLRPCLAMDHEESAGSCRHFTYPSLNGFDNVRGEGAFVALEDERQQVFLAIDPRVESGVAPINDQQNEIHMDLRVSRPGSYVLLLVYVTPPNGHRSHVDVDVSTQQERQSGQAVLYDCTSSHTCRQIVTDAQGKIAHFNFDSNYVSVVVRGHDSPETAIDSVVAIPSNQWTLDFVNPKSVCVRRDGSCVAGLYPTASDSTRVEFETGDQDQASNLPEEIFDENAGLVYLDAKNPSVEINGKVPSAGYYVFIIHYNQPIHPQFDATVLLQNGQFYDASVAVPFCPSNAGCRSVVKQADGNQMFQITENFILTLRTPANKSMWVDYIYAVPSSDFTPNLIEESPIDLTAEFIARCGKNNFQMDATSSEFCQKAVFTLTTEFNSGALPCQCNAEGSMSFECDQFGGQCPCKPGVIGRQCTRCKTGYFGFPDCKPCDCPSTALCDANTGSCICPPRVTGARCDQCVANTYGYDPIIGCEECNCSPLGVFSNNLQCDSSTGQCQCKQNVVSRTCERCAFGYWAFPHCQLCDCDVRGASEEICDQDTAQCFCKENVHGPSCDTCKPGTFDLQEANPRGCNKCFCFGKASTCTSSQLYRSKVTDMTEWSGTTVSIGSTASRRSAQQIQAYDQTIRAVLSGLLPEDGTFYFSAPATYLGNKLTSYGGYLNYTIVYVQGPAGYSVSAPDLILIGGDLTLYHFGQSLSASVMTNVLVEITERNFVLPTGLPATRENLMVVLKDIKALYIRGSYSDPTTEVRLMNVLLDIASRQFDYTAEVAVAVEQCNCPASYQGTSCEDCAPGFFRAQTGPYGGFCVPCQCNGHADTCDPVTGVCINCKHSTTGDHCEKCEVGYHGDATRGSPSDCLICACPLPVTSNNFATECDVSDDGTQILCECRPGYTGPLCEACAPGFYGEPQVMGDYCKPCNCSGNIDVNDPGACDSITGQCIKCLNNAHGDACSLCAPGFFGDAVALKDCQKCHCNECGTSECQSYTGQCQCQANVIGEKCDRCAPDHYGFASCRGCRPCNCAPASEGTQCDENSGQCRCRPGAAGRHCERCASGFWNYGPAGCQSCNCNTNFSIGVGCNPETGQCECLPGVIGEKCETCPHRWILIPDAGCEECTSCHHHLLDVTDELREAIDPLSREFETVALTFFTHQKLVSINQSVSDLRLDVVQLDVSQISFGPLEAVTVELEADSRSLKIKSGYIDDEAAEKINQANQVQTDAAEVENLIREAVAKSRATIAEVTVLAESLEGGAGPQIDKALQEAQTILQEIRSRNLVNRQTSAEQELREAIVLLGRMREEALPVRDNNVLVAGLTTRLKDLMNRVADLGIQMGKAEASSAAADALTARNRASASLGAVEDIQFRNGTISNYLSLSSQLVSKATELLENAQSALRQLGEEVDRVNTAKESLEQALEDRENALAESQSKLAEAQRHADKLTRQAADLDLLLTDTRQTSENAVSAANSYKNIVDAIDEALKAALEAKTSAENATSLSGGVGERAMDSRQRSESLLTDAENALKRTKMELEPRLAAAEAAARLVEDFNQRTSDSLVNINGILDKLPAYELVKAAASAAAEAGSAAVQSGSEASERINMLSAKIPATLEKSKQMGRDVDVSGKAISLSLTQIDRLNSVLPDLRDLLSRTNRHLPILKRVGSDVEQKLAELRQKVALARDQANRIKVGVTFYPNSTLQLRNPEGLSRAATSNKLSLFFRTADPNGFLAYLGNEVGTSKKLRRVSTDDFMALEINNGYLSLTTDLGSGPQSITNERYVSDDMWYQAIVERTGKSVRLSVRAEKEAGAEEIISKDAVLPGTFSILNLDQELTKLYVGGYPSTARIQPVVRFASFQGQVEEVNVGDVEVGLWNFVDAENIYGAVERDKLKILQQSTGFRFDGEGYAILDRRSYRFHDRIDVQLQFKTNADNGLLFLAGKEQEFMSVELSKGQVSYKFNLGDGATVVMSSPQMYNDGQWHTIEAVRNRRDGILKVDGQEVAQGTSEGADGDLAVTEFMYFGGYPGQHTFAEVTNIDFDGCIDNVQISGTPVDLSLNHESFGVVAGCPAKVANIVSFGGSGYVALPGVNIENFVQVNFKLKTEEKDGLLFYMANEDQSNRLSLSMVDGALVLRAEPGGEVSSPVTNKLDDGLWHVVTATVDGQQIRLDIDDYEVYTLDVPPSSFIIPATPIYFAGIPETFAMVPGAAASDSSFTGCIGDTTVNGKFINYAASTDNRGASVDKCPIPDAGAPLPPIKPKQERPRVPLLPDRVPVEQPTPAPTSPVPVVTQPQETDEEEEAPAPTTAATTTEEVVTTPAPPETTVAPQQCRLPLQPADDPDVNESSGTRFGNVKYSRFEFGPLPGRHRQKSELSVDFKTSEPDGIIFYAAEDRHIDFVTLYLKDGKLHFSFNCGTGPALLVSSASYNDNVWHTAAFNRDRQNGTLIVDGVAVAEGSSPGNTQTINIDPPHFLGGISPEALNNGRHNFKGVETGLVGCMRDFRAHGRPVGDPVYTEGTEPCSTKVEDGSFFASNGSYIKAEETFRVGLDIDIRMEIKPRSTSGILMSVHGRRDFLILQMVNGSLIFSVDNGRGPIVTTFLPQHEHHLCDGKWHYIEAIKAKNVVTLSVDNVFVEPGIGVAGVSSTDTNNPLWIGGHPKAGRLRGMQTSEQFIGCIRNVTVNKKLQRFNSVQAMGSVTATTCPTI